MRRTAVERHRRWQRLLALGAIAALLGLSGTAAPALAAGPVGGALHAVSRAAEGLAPTSTVPAPAEGAPAVPTASQPGQGTAAGSSAAVQAVEQVATTATAARASGAGASSAPSPGSTASAPATITHTIGSTAAAVTTVPTGRAGIAPPAGVGHVLPKQASTVQAGTISHAARAAELVAAARPTGSVLGSTKPTATHATGLLIRLAGNATDGLRAAGPLATLGGSIREMLVSTARSLGAATGAPTPFPSRLTAPLGIPSATAQVAPATLDTVGKATAAITGAATGGHQAPSAGRVTAFSSRASAAPSPSALGASPAAAGGTSAPASRSRADESSAAPLPPSSPAGSGNGSSAAGSASGTATSIFLGLVGLLALGAAGAWLRMLLADGHRHPAPVLLIPQPPG